MDTPLAVMARVVMSLAGLLSTIFFLSTLRNALKRCAPVSRTMAPWKVWLTLIPLFGLIWQFFVVLHVGDSLENEFARLGIACPGLKGAQAIGLGMCICSSCVLVPVRLVRDLILTVAFVLWAAYWFRIANFSQVLARHPSAASVSPIR